MAKFTKSYTILSAEATAPNPTNIKPNQDRSFIWTSPDGKIQGTGMIDGHGDLGHITAESARILILADLNTNYYRFNEDAPDYLEHLKEIAHDACKEGIRKHLTETRENFREVETEYGNFFVKRIANNKETVVSGGCTLTLRFIINSTVYYLNLGDSDAIICTPLPPKNEDGTNATPINILSETMIDRIAGPYLESEPNEDTVSNLQMTTLVKCESPALFKRLLDFRKSPIDPTVPILKQLYDNRYGYTIPAIQLTDGVPETIKITEELFKKGVYVKNVNNEVASLLKTPDDPEFYMSCGREKMRMTLAMPESIGDDYIHTFGVSKEAHNNKIELEPIFDKLKEAGLPEIICMVEATDGIWDCMTKELVTLFLMDHSCINALSKETGVQEVANSFLQRNMVHAKRLFGNSHDDCTVCVTYVKRN